MLRSLFVVVLITLMVSDTQAQGASSYDVSYGYNLYNSKFLGHLNTKQDFSMNAPVRFVGFGGSAIGPSEKSGKTIAVIIHTQYYLPSRFTADSMNLRISGFRFSYALGTGLHTANYKLSLSACAGITAGRMLVKGKEQGIKQNTYLCPKIIVQPKILLGPVALSVAGEYQYDSTKVDWSNTRFHGKSAMQLPGFDQSGLCFYVSVGWHVGG